MRPCLVCAFAYCDRLLRWASTGFKDSLPALVSEWLADLAARFDVSSVIRDYPERPPSAGKYRFGPIRPPLPSYTFA